MTEFGIGAAFAGGSSLVVLLIALIADAVLAGLPWIGQALRAPRAAIGAIAGWFDDKLNRSQRSAANRMIRGALVVVAIAGLAAVIGIYLAEIAGTVTQGWAIEAVLVTVTLSQRHAFARARGVRRALRRHGVEAGREALAREIGYDASALDQHSVARGAIETCAARFCDGVIAPVFWYLLLGLPGLFVFWAVNAVAARIGHPSPRHAAFGMTAARLDHALNYLSAPIAGAILAVAAIFVPRGHPWRALRVMLRDSRIRPSPAEGWGESAAAGALELALGGPRRYDETVISGPWIGDGRARAAIADIGRMAFMYMIACMIVAGLVAMLALAAA